MSHATFTYLERHSFPGEARGIFANLRQEDRDWTGAELAAAQEACSNHLDFTALLSGAEELLT